MPTVDNRGIQIHYEVHGIGHPIVLIHGGTVSFKNNYADFGWIESLNNNGLQVIGLDLRGHGKSGKLHEIESYGTSNLASDVVAVLDQLSLARVSIQASYAALSKTDAAAITIPTLVVSGQADLVLGQGPKLAKSLGQGSYVEAPGADHFSLAADSGVKAAVSDFMRPATA